MKNAVTTAIDPSGVLTIGTSEVLPLAWDFDTHTTQQAILHFDIISMQPLPSFLFWNFVSKRPSFMIAAGLFFGAAHSDDSDAAACCPGWRCNQHPRHFAGLRSPPPGARNSREKITLKTRVCFRKQ